MDITFDLRKTNFINPRGGGIIGRIFVDGVEVFSQPIANNDGIGIQDTITHEVQVGSVLDFAIDPTGEVPDEGSDGIFSARADGSAFEVVIEEHIPEPGSLTLLFLGGVVLGLKRRVM